jgi:hypothetical protein
MFHPFHIDIAFKCFMSCVSRCSESQGAQGVMVARHGCWVMMGRDELVVGGWGVLGAAGRGLTGARCCAEWGERPRIEADRAGYTCEASRVDAWALR